MNAPERTLTPAWRGSLALLVLMLATVLLAFSGTAVAMVTIWERSETFAHAFLVPPLSLWLIWRMRARLLALTPKAMPWVALPMAVVTAGWLLAELAAINAATQFALVALLVLCVPLCLGWQLTRAMAFPLGFLFFAVPAGEFFTPVMMNWTANFAIVALQASGVPVYREGLSFVIPSGSWSVIEACSGIRYLIASMMVGTLFAYLNYRSLKRRLIFVGVAFVLPIVANWLRAYMIVMIGHLSDNRLAVGVDHLIYGWVFFGIVMMLLFMIGMRWSEPADTAPPAPQAPGGAPWSPAPLLVSVALGLAVLILPAWAARQYLNGEGAPVALIRPDLASGGWAASARPGYSPRFERPRGELLTSYSRPDGTRVGLYVAYYRQQSYDSKLISSSNVLVPSTDKQWNPVAAGQVSVPVFGAARSATLLNRRAPGVDPQRDGLRVWQMYWVDGQWMTSDWQAKLRGAVARLLGRGDDSAVLVLFTERRGSDGGDAVLADFAGGNAPAINAWLGGIAAREKTVLAGQ